MPGIKLTTEFRTALNWDPAAFEEENQGRIFSQPLQAKYMSNRGDNPATLAVLRPS